VQSCFKNYFQTVQEYRDEFVTEMDGVTLMHKKQFFRNGAFWLSVAVHFNQWLNTPAHEISEFCISSVLNDLCLLGPSDVSAMMKFSRRPTCPDASVAASLPTPPVPRHRKSHSLGNKWVLQAVSHSGNFMHRKGLR